MSRAGREETVKPTWYLYIVSCSDNTLYTGITTDILRRVEQHNKRQGAAYTASRTPVTLLAAWSYPDRSQATHAEYVMKRRSRPSKLKAIEQNSTFEDGNRIPDDELGASRSG